MVIDYSSPNGLRQGGREYLHNIFLQITYELQMEKLYFYSEEIWCITP